MINKIYHPFDKKFNVALTSGEQRLCLLFNDFLNSTFENIDSKLNQNWNIKYFKEGSNFCFKINESLIIRFSVSILLLDSNISLSDFSNIDIVIPIFRLNKYHISEYDRIASETDAIVKKVTKINKAFIVSYLNTEYILDNQIEDEKQWHFISNELQEIIMNGTLESKIGLNEKGKSILKGLFKILHYHSKQQRNFQIQQKINFFISDSRNSKISFGKNEFIANLLIQLLNFDKLNSYSFQINSK